MPTFIRAFSLALEAGAKVLQSNTPLHPFDVYLVGFHPMKAHPEQQMEAHHYCHQVNEDFAQCTLSGGNGKDARLNGIELQKLARPQHGVDDLKGKFARPTKDIPGVAAQPAQSR